MRRSLLNLARLGVSAGLLAYLVVEVQRSDPQIWTRLRETAVHWPTLLLGWGCLLASLAAGVLRWQLVLQALGLAVPLRWLFRSALFGFALDFAALGTAGGDLVKTLLLARRAGGGRVVVLVSVIVDRVIGLQAMLTLAAIVLLATDLLQPRLSLLRNGLIAAAVGLNLALAVFWMSPRLACSLQSRGRLMGRCGRVLADVVGALHRIRERPLSLLPAEVINVATLIVLVTGCHLVAISLPGEMPTYGEQWQAVPIAMLSAVLPLPGGSLGALDYAMSLLYQHVSGGRVALGQGFLVVMVSRTVSVAVSVLAVLVYTTSSEGGREHRPAEDPQQNWERRR